MPQYTSAMTGTVAATSSNKRKLENAGKVVLPKKLKAKAKAVAGPAEDAEACPELPRGVKPLTQPQAKRVAKTLEAISSDSMELTQLINQVLTEAYVPFLPPYLLLAARVHQGALEELTAPPEAMMADEWAGNFAACWKEAQPARQEFTGSRAKLKHLVNKHGPKHEAKGEAK